MGGSQCAKNFEPERSWYLCASCRSTNRSDFYCWGGLGSCSQPWRTYVITLPLIIQKIVAQQVHGVVRIESVKLYTKHASIEAKLRNPVSCLTVSSSKLPRRDQSIFPLVVLDVSSSRLRAVSLSIIACCSSSFLFCSWLCRFFSSKVSQIVS